MMEKGRELKVHSYDDLLNAYLSGDLKKVNDVLNADSALGIKYDMAMKDRMLKLMLDGRNPGMAQSIIKELSLPDSGSCFFAAGTAHYVGTNSIIDLIKAAGYKVTLVQN